MVQINIIKEIELILDFLSGCSAFNNINQMRIPGKRHMYKYMEKNAHFNGYHSFTPLPSLPRLAED